MGSISNDALDEIYDAMEGSDVARRYFDRHSVKSQAILTVSDDGLAAGLAAHLAPRIEGRIVVEIGGGIGLLACHMGRIAKRVFCIEANPSWSSIFIAYLYERKPQNVSFLFGSAAEFAGLIRGDVAVICTHSDVAGMTATAGLFAPEVIDVYGEMIAESPEQFDPLAVLLREKF